MFSTFGHEEVGGTGSNAPDAVTSSMGQSLASGANQIWLGGSPDGGDGAVRMSGLLDEVYLFDRALSRTELQSLQYNNSLTNSAVNVLPPPSAVNVAAGAILELGGVSQTVAMLTGSGLVTNSGAPATLVLSNGTGSAAFDGSLGDLGLGSSLSVVIAGAATTILSGANSYHGNTAISGGTLLVNGSLGSGAVFVAGGTLGGTGTIGGAVTVQPGGTLAPGGGASTLAANTVNLQPGSLTLMELDKSNLTNDQLLVAGALSYGGTLLVTHLAGTLAAGDSFQLFSAGSVSGSFAATNLPPLAPGLNWNFDPASGVLRVLPEIYPTNIVCTVGHGTLTLSWPPDHLGWRLLVQTNHLAVGLSRDPNDWGTVANSQQTNQILVPINPALPGEYYRLSYP